VDGRRAASLYARPEVEDDAGSRPSGRAAAVDHPASEIWDEDGAEAPRSEVNFSLRALNCLMRSRDLVQDRVLASAGARSIR
jgi:hypothetical protein